MKYASTILIAALMSSTALAQAPQAPNKPPTKAAKPTAPVKAPAAPSKAAELMDESDRKPTADEELALAALEGLMQQPPERALPIIKKVLAGSQPTLVKQRALFVLSQIDGPEASQLLAQQSRSSDPAIRGEAIRSIGIGGDPKLLDSLQELYKTGSPEVKEEVLQAWLISDHKDAVYQVALNAKSEDEANKAIHMLGAMGATEELRKLSDRPNAASSLVDAFAISGDLESLRKIIDGNNDRSIRVDAVRKIGIIDGDAAHTALREIYSRSGSDPEIREAALQGMMMSDDEQGVLALYRAAKTNEEKRALMRMLSMMDGDGALKAIDEALGEKK